MIRGPYKRTKHPSTKPTTIVSAEDVKKLLDDVDITTRTRFNAAKRCSDLGSLSNWTISIISLMLIALPVMQNLSVIPFSSDNPAQNATSIILAAFILVFSQISNIENYSLRSYRYHECAVRLNRLKRLIKPYAALGIQIESYEDLICKYDDIIKDYENHIDLDYQTTRWQEFKKALARMTAEEIRVKNYPKTFWVYNQRWNLIYLRLTNTSRFWLALGISFTMIIWSTYYPSNS